MAVTVHLAPAGPGEEAKTVVYDTASSVTLTESGDLLIGAGRLGAVGVVNGEFLVCAIVTV